MIGSTPSWVGDATAICALVIGVGAVVALVLRAAKPHLVDVVRDVVEKVTGPKFTALDEKIDDANRRLDEHMRREEATGQRQEAAQSRLIQTIALLIGKLDRHEDRLDEHIRDPKAHR